MEALYYKLYEKYIRLKTNKASQIEQYTFDQEQKFKAYVSAADELIVHLKNEKDTLDAQVSELRHELASIRSAKDEEQQKYEHMLLKENLKRYTFNLGYVKNASGEEELMYKVSLLGTFERVAPEWMRDVMLFSKTMSRIFFKKVSTIMKLQE